MSKAQEVKNLWNKRAQAATTLQAAARRSAAVAAARSRIQQASRNNSARYKKEWTRASAMSREYIHPGYYANRAKRAQGHVGLVDIFSQLTGYLAQPIDYNERLVRATRVAAMTHGNPSNLGGTPPQLRREGTATPYVIRDLTARIDTLLDQFLLDVPERTIESQSILFEVLRRGLSTYVELLRGVTAEARAALCPTRRAYSDYLASLAAESAPQIRRSERRLASVRSRIQSVRAQMSRPPSPANAARVAGLRREEERLERSIASMRTNGTGNSSRTTTNLRSAKQFAQLRAVKASFPSSAARVATRFLRTQHRQRNSAVKTRNGTLKRWACANAGWDKAFLANGSIQCVDARLHSVITAEYRAATGGRDVKADVDTEKVPLRTVFGDRIVKRNLVLHSFLDTLSDALLTLNPRVKMNPTAARGRDAATNAVHPFHRRFERAGGDWRVVDTTNSFTPRAYR